MHFEHVFAGTIDAKADRVSTTFPLQWIEHYMNLCYLWKVTRKMRGVLPGEPEGNMPEFVLGSPYLAMCLTNAV